MILHSAQSLIAKDTHRFRVVNCGRRFGKTALAVLEMIAKALSDDNVRVAYFANTYQQARDIAWQMLKSLAAPAIVNVNESRLEVQLRSQKGGTSTITLRGWESVETARGIALHFVVLDEVASMKNFWPNWQEIVRPTLTDFSGEGLFISTPKGFNHFYDLCQLEHDPERGRSFKTFHFTSYENPHIPKEELDEARAELPDNKFAQEYLADFRKTEGLVYKEFNRSLHIVDKVPQESKAVIGGIDFGFTNPYASVVIKVDYDNNYWVISEKYLTGKTNTDIIDITKQETKDYSVSYWYPDNAEPDRILEMKRAGLNCKEISKGRGSILSGIDLIRELLKSNRIKIHSSCSSLIVELETYRYADKRINQNEPEEPIKENDHALDALRYAIVTYNPLKKTTTWQYTPKY